MTTKKFFICLALIFLTNYSYSSTAKAINNGDWNQNSTWNNGVPGCVDTIIVPANIQVDVTSNINMGGCSETAVILHGVMYFDQGSRLEMYCDSYVLIMLGGSIKANNYKNNGKKIKICNNTVWQGKDGEITGPAGLGNSPLPIELLTFKVNSVNEREVIVNWTTASELDNDYFTVEKSKDGINWEVVATINGAGTSSSTMHYRIIDRPNSMVVIYYRLKQTDFDGNYTYSPVVSLKNEINELYVYPNPAQSGTDIMVHSNQVFKSTDVVELYNASGNLVKRINATELEYNHSFVLNTKEIESGVYILKINDQTQKIVLR